MIAQGREAVILRAQSPVPSRRSSEFLMPTEPDALWQLLRLETRYRELRVNLRVAQGSVAYGIAQEMEANRRQSADLKDLLGVSDADLIALSYDTPPSLMSLSFGGIDEDPKDTPPASSSADDFVVSLRGSGMSFPESIECRLEFSLGNTLRSEPLAMSRRTEDWEYLEFTTRTSLSALGASAGTHAVVLIEMKLKSGRIVTRSLLRFICE